MRRTKRKGMENPQFAPKGVGLLLYITNLKEYSLSVSVSLNLTIPIPPEKYWALDLVSFIIIIHYFEGDIYD